MKGFHVPALILAAAILALPQPARAEAELTRRTVVLRNDTERVVSVVLGYPSEHHFGVAHGWYRVDPYSERRITRPDVCVDPDSPRTPLYFYAKSGIRRWQRRIDLDSSLDGMRVIVATKAAFVTYESTSGWEHLTVGGREADESVASEEVAFRTKNDFSGTLIFTASGQNGENGDTLTALADVVESMRQTVRLRNATGKDVSAALAYSQDGGSMAARGWFNLKPWQTREIVLNGVDRREDAQLWYYAKSGAKRWQGDDYGDSTSIPIPPHRAFLTQFINSSLILALDSPQWIVEINKLWYQYQPDGDFAGKWLRQVEDYGNETEEIDTVYFLPAEEGFYGTVTFAGD